jgi:hypothetical protein
VGVAVNDSIPRFEVIDDETAAMWRRHSEVERLRIANRMFLFARRTIAADLRREHPDWDDARVTSETARRLLGGSI